jgi:hypothetical protein
MMKWMLVVLVNGITPVNTDLVFEKFTDCLAAEEQMRKQIISSGGGITPGHVIYNRSGC